MRSRIGLVLIPLCCLLAPAAAHARAPVRVQAASLRQIGPALTFSLRMSRAWTPSAGPCLTLRQAARKLRLCLEPGQGPFPIELDRAVTAPITRRDAPRSESSWGSPAPGAEDLPCVSTWRPCADSS